MTYTTRIVSVGPEAASFLEERLAITFAGKAPTSFATTASSLRRQR